MTGRNSFMGQNVRFDEKVQFEKGFYTNAGNGWKTFRFKLMFQKKILSLGQWCGETSNCLVISWMCRVRYLWYWTYASYMDRGSTTDPSINVHLHYPSDIHIDRSLNESVVDKIRKYRSTYNNNPPNTISFMSDIDSTSGRLNSDFVLLLFLAWCSPHNSNPRFGTFSQRLQHYGLLWI